MRCITGYYLAVLGGNQEPEAEDITIIFSSVGIKNDVNKSKEIVQEIDGHKMKELIAEEPTKISSFPTGEAASVPVAKETVEVKAAKKSSSESLDILINALIY